MKESRLKAKLNVMCQKPQKLLVHFYHDKEDFSLGDRLRLFAQSAIKPCFWCKELTMNHVFCYYHKNGYVEIRMKKDGHHNHDLETLSHGKHLSLICNLTLEL